MQIPKLKYPTKTVKLPVSNKEVTIRPFLVKEQKVILMSAEAAVETGDIKEIYKAIGTITDNCVVSDNFNINELPFVEIEYLFLKIRALSVGENIEINLPCSECKNMNKVSIDLDKIEIIIPEKYENVIDLPETEDGVKWQLKMKLPTYEIMLKIDMENIDKIGGDIIAECMDQLFNDKGEVINPIEEWGKEKTVSEFIETFDSTTFTKIETFFYKAPKLEYKAKYKCKECSHENEYVMDSIADFF